ncbi:MAG: DUF2628 domain-containing protein [Rickettsiales bacterium]
MSLFSKTNIYTVHIDPSHNRSVENAVFIREGFNFLAFVVAPIWALYNRMWLEFFLIMVFTIILTVVSETGYMNEVSIGFINLGFNFAIGSWAGDIQRYRLSRKGYILSDVVVSSDEIAAQQRYFENITVS